MKEIGSRKEVYVGIALKTSGGMTREDIIKSVKEKAKKLYLSKKISSRMKYNSPLVLYRKTKQSKKKQSDLGKLNVSDLKKMLSRERRLQRIKRRKLKSLKSQKSLKEKNKDKSKKLRFSLNKNKTKEFYCSRLNNDDDDDSYSTTSFNGYERDDEDENEDEYNTSRDKKEFKIEALPEISLEELFI